MSDSIRRPEVRQEVLSEDISTSKTNHLVQVTQHHIQTLNSLSRSLQRGKLPSMRFVESYLELFRQDFRVLKSYPKLRG